MNYNCDERRLTDGVSEVPEAMETVSARHAKEGSADADSKKESQASNEHDSYVPPSLSDERSHEVYLTVERQVGVMTLD